MLSAWLLACRLVALALPDPVRATGSRPLIPPDQTGSSGWTTQSGSLDGPLRQLYFRTAD